MNRRPDIVYIKLNSLRSEPRLIKMYAAAKRSYKCNLLLWNLDRTKETNKDAISLNYYIPFGSFKLKAVYGFWFLFCLYHLFRLRPKIIHACDLEANLIARTFKFFCPNTRILYDIYDVTADKYFFNSISKKRRIILAVERYFIKKADLLIIPDIFRLEQLNFSPEDISRLNFKVIYNSDEIPLQTDKKCEFSGKEIKLVYVGILSKNIRGLEHIMYAAKEMSEIDITVAGFGVDEGYFKTLFDRAKLPNLRFLGRVSFLEAKKLNKESDIMLSLLNPKFNNYRYATSTKIFDAFACGKPVITTAGTASAKLVEETSWGAAIKYSKHDLVRILRDIISGKLSFELKVDKVKKYSWGECSSTLLSMYRHLLNSK